MTTDQEQLTLFDPTQYERTEDICGCQGGAS